MLKLNIQMSVLKYGKEKREPLRHKLFFTRVKSMGHKHLFVLFTVVFLTSNP